MKSKILTLNKNKDFQRLYMKGRSSVSVILVTYVMKNRACENYIGITTSKKVGNAVKRNRTRRIIKEAYRQLSPSLAEGYNIVFVGRAKTAFVKCQDVLYEMRKHMRKLGVLP